ncbi:1,2-dihydroxy-3-keto-5-methylthiopentene dioxygenase [Hyalangium rubrum]|uniref:Acireductone dioxygenase n=1 Tax=Hyalangium rubrum TaxID=3103134 RepID=A0ABU5H6K5_9BACT|nr:cupin [Hyalangium sp. s54d21]MDY7227725.1 cupin [Hyalangium sp. s54d21]
MSTLKIFAEEGAPTPRVTTSDSAEIARLLGAQGVRFERWETRALPPSAGQAEILSSYAAEVARLKAENGFQSADVINLTPSHPQKEEMRRKFLSEHRHSEDEVRFFVRGRGLFYLHLGTEVYALLCEQQDLISVPTGTRHWFDMGPEPDFTCIRLFTSTEGWAAQWTGDGIAERLPRFEKVVHAG